MKDFFVSYTGKDVKYAIWVAELLENNGYTVTIQAWDFRPGDNFVAKINEALKECKRLIVILSRNYLNSKWCEAEWTSKLAEEISTNEPRIIPIRIEPVELEGLLAPIIYIDIYDKSEENAKQNILNGIKENKIRKSEGFPEFYNVKHETIDLEYYVEDEQITFIKTCKTQILTEGKNKIHNRITWFPDENVELYSLSKGVQIEYIQMPDTNLNYNIVFDHELQKGEKIEFCVKAVLSNKNKHFQNFFATEVIVPITNLNMHLKIEDKMVREVYTQKLSSSPMNVRTEKPKKHELYNIFHWHIENPELNFEYKIYW